MPYNGLMPFIGRLAGKDQLIRITEFADPVLEIAEIADRIVKSGNGKALLFENTGTSFPLLINAFGSSERMELALGRNPDTIAGEIEGLFDTVTSGGKGILGSMVSLPKLVKAASVFPSHTNAKGECQQVIHTEPDLSILPILKCWPHDGGRFVTLPMVHTFHPRTGKTNVGMYRMQVIDGKTTAMHWQRHKTGANHFGAWKEEGRKMPVAVALGGDPVYTYAATAPLPENISEYILAGFLRQKKVKLVKCITCDIRVPSDADIVIEGYVDPSEEPVWEGPFGDHTGFYSLADWYPRFHVTCITHRKDAVYPATIVGIPPQEDAWLAETTEKIFLTPLRMAVQPEIIDMHLPVAGTAHNLVIIKLSKSYPGQGIKVLNSLSGAGQMMFSKYMIAVSGEVNIRDYSALAKHIAAHTDPSTDILFSRGPLDVLDHSSDTFSFGGKAAIDATEKLPEEVARRKKGVLRTACDLKQVVSKLRQSPLVKSINDSLCSEGIPILLVTIDPSSDPGAAAELAKLLAGIDPDGHVRLTAALDHTVDVNDFFTAAWQLLANTDPVRDRHFVSGSSILLDGTIKALGKEKFPRRWPNIVCSSPETIDAVDRKWESFGLGEFIPSPSLKYKALCRKGNEEISPPG